MKVLPEYCKSETSVIANFTGLHWSKVNMFTVKIIFLENPINNACNILTICICANASISILSSLMLEHISKII